MRLKKYPLEFLNMPDRHAKPKRYAGKAKNNPVVSGRQLKEPKGGTTLSKKGKLIVVEGADGCGKDTQVEHLEENLKKLYPKRKVVLTFEPWDHPKSPSGRRIRRIISGQESSVDPEDDGIDTEKLQTVYTADRYIHWTKFIIPALKEGNIVVSNRERMSTFAYGHAFGISLEEMVNWHSLLPDPDLVIYVKVSVDEVVRRIQARNRNKDFFEKRKSLEKIIKSYDYVAKSGVFPNLVEVDGEGNVKEVAERIENLFTDEKHLVF